MEQWVNLYNGAVMTFKQSFKNADHREVFGMVQQAKDIHDTCRILFQWLVERYSVESDYKAVLEDDGDAIFITTPAGVVRSRVVMMEERSAVFARIVFVARLDPADSHRDVPVFALTVRDRYSVIAGDEPGREWAPGRSQELWGSREPLALGYDLVAGLLATGFQLLAKSQHQGVSTQ
jgi:hypothetical protein